MFTNCGSRVGRNRGGGYEHLKRIALVGATSGHFAPPAGFKHLEVYFSGRGVVASVIGPNISLQFNGDSGANYDQAGPQTQGAAVASNSIAAQTVAVMGIIPGSTATADCTGEGWAKIFNYALGDRKKSVFTGGGMIGATANGASFLHRTHNVLWRNNAPIQLVTLFSDNGAFDTGSYVDFFGIR